jgi:hypothetical protein
MSDADLRDQAVAELKQTTVGYINKKWTVPPEGTHWQKGLALLAQIGAVTPPAPSTGTVRTAQPGQAAAAIAASSGGDTVVLQGGWHPALVLAKDFPVTSRLLVKADPGSGIKSNSAANPVSLDYNGHAGYEFDLRGSLGVRRDLLSGESYSDIGIRAIEAHGGKHITYRGPIYGGFVGFSPYGPAGNWTDSLELADFDLSGSWGDLIHPNGFYNLTVHRGKIHDPQHLTSEHHDCFQPQNGDGFLLDRIEAYWTSGAGAYAGPTTSYLGQVVMISGEQGAVKNGVISNVLAHHYNGRFINCNGITGLDIVCCTEQNCGDGIGITVGTNVSGLRVWDNIVECVYTSGSTPALLDHNWYTGRIPDGYLGNAQGTNWKNGDPKFLSTGVGGYKLAADSPCRGFGTATPAPPAVDLGGAARDPAHVVVGCWA